jgi:hypothetical protein
MSERGEASGAYRYGWGFGLIANRARSYSFRRGGCAYAPEYGPAAMDERIDTGGGKPPAQSP